MDAGCFYYFKVNSSVFQGLFEESLKMFEESFRDILTVFQGNLEDFKICFKYLNDASSLFQ